MSGPRERRERGEQYLLRREPACLFWRRARGIALHDPTVPPAANP